MHVEIVANTLDFTSWMRPFGMRISGIAATHSEPLANHLWRIVSRSDLPTLGFTDAAIEVSNVDWKDIAPDGADAVLLTKAYLHSNMYSQQPILLLPADIAERLDKAG